MKTTRELIWSMCVAVVAVVAASAVALWLIPQLSLEATIRGGTIALFAIIGSRLGMWWTQRRKQTR